MKYKIIFLLFVISLASSIILFLLPNSNICTMEKMCDTVLNSQYAETFGIKNDLFGIVIFSFMSLITISHLTKPKKYKEGIIKTGIFIGSIIAIYFLYLQYFVLHTYCQYCLVVDFSLLSSLSIILIWKK